MISEQRFAGEEQRIAEAYARRTMVGKTQWYRPFRQDIQLERYRLRSVTASLLNSYGWREFSALQVLDVGCGMGGWLRTLLDWGVSPEQLHGIDLLADRIAYAKRLTPQMDLRQATGWAIPYPDASMDMLTAHTVFSSILQPDARAQLAQEMRRVVKPGGVVMVYDFRISDPRNHDTTGITPAEVRRLFAGMPAQVRWLTLPPIITRKVAPISPFLALLMEWIMPWLRTHRMYLLKKTE